MEKAEPGDTGRGIGARRGGACARALAAGAPPLGRHVGWRVGVKRCTGSGRSRLSSVAGGCSLAHARAGNGGEPRLAGLGRGLALEPGGAGRGPSFPPVRGRPWSTGFPVAGRGVHCAASRTPPGWTAQPGSAPPEPALGWEDICLPAWAPVLASHLSYGAFSLEQPRPSPECALPPALPSPASEPAGLLQGGVPYPKSSPRRLGSPTRPPLYSTAGTGAAEPGSSCLLFRVGWQRPGGPVGRVRVGEPRVGPASSGRPSFCCVPALFAARAERVGRVRPFLEESRPTGFCLQPEVGPVALQGVRQRELPRNPSAAGVSLFLSLRPQSLPSASSLSYCLGAHLKSVLRKDGI